MTALIPSCSQDEHATPRGIPTAGRRSYRKTKQNVALAFLFNGIGVPAAATGLVYPVWAMAAMALSVTTIFINSLGDRPALLFEALRSVGRVIPQDGKGDL